MTTTLLDGVLYDLTDYGIGIWVRENGKETQVSFGRVVIAGNQNQRVLTDAAARSDNLQGGEK